MSIGCHAQLYFLLNEIIKSLLVNLSMGNFLAEYPRQVRSFVLCLCVYFCSAVGAQAQHMHVASRSTPPAHTLGYSDYTGIITSVLLPKVIVDASM